MTPPVFSFFRKVLKDFEYEGYLIPKGWQVWFKSLRVSFVIVTYSPVLQDNMYSAKF
jgi:hypothetical protein